MPPGGGVRLRRKSPTFAPFGRVKGMAWRPPLTKYKETFFFHR